MIYVKSPAQIAAMRTTGALLYEVLAELRQAAKPGISTQALNEIAEKKIRDHGATPSFLGYRGFPATLCTSLNEQVVHGIPSDDVILREGDILSVDCGLILNGWHSDSAFTVGIGTISPEKRRLIDVTEQCFFAGARQALNGGRLQDISHAVQELAESHGYGVVRELVGHGIGREMHEEPSVPNFGRAGQGVRLREGMTLAVEPMIAMHNPAVRELEDGWTVITVDQSPCSHYEHTLVISEHGLPELLSYPGYVFTEVDRA
ncbi:MAG: type I methionyl aminopeptidase [Bacillota bacterium]